MMARIWTIMVITKSTLKMYLLVYFQPWAVAPQVVTELTNLSK